MPHPQPQHQHQHHNVQQGVYHTYAETHHQPAPAPRPPPAQPPNLVPRLPPPASFRVSNASAGTVLNGQRHVGSLAAPPVAFSVAPAGSGGDKQAGTIGTGKVVGIDQRPASDIAFIYDPPETAVPLSAARVPSWEHSRKAQQEPKKFASMSPPKMSTLAPSTPPMFKNRVVVSRENMIGSRPAVPLCQAKTTEDPSRPSRVHISGPQNLTDSHLQPGLVRSSEAVFHVPTENDVMICPGGSRHIGNRNYGQLVQRTFFANFESVHSELSHKMKLKLVSKLVLAFRRRGGHFLKPTAVTGGEWIDVGDAMAGEAVLGMLGKIEEAKGALLNGIKTPTKKDVVCCTKGGNQLADRTCGMNEYLLNKIEVIYDRSVSKLAGDKRARKILAIELVHELRMRDARFLTTTPKTNTKTNTWYDVGNPKAHAIVLNCLKDVKNMRDGAIAAAAAGGKAGPTQAQVLMQVHEPAQEPEQGPVQAPTQARIRPPSEHACLPSNRFVKKDNSGDIKASAPPRIPPRTTMKFIKVPDGFHQKYLAHLPDANSESTLEVPSCAAAPSNTPQHRENKSDGNSSTRISIKVPSVIPPRIMINMSDSIKHQISVPCPMEEADDLETTHSHARIPPRTTIPLPPKDVKSQVLGSHLSNKSDVSEMVEIFETIEEGYVMLNTSEGTDSKVSLPQPSDKTGNSETSEQPKKQIDNKVVLLPSESSGNSVPPRLPPRIGIKLPKINADPTQKKNQSFVPLASNQVSSTNSPLKSKKRKKKNSSEISKGSCKEKKKKKRLNDDSTPTGKLSQDDQALYCKNALMHKQATPESPYGHTKAITIQLPRWARPGSSFKFKSPEGNYLEVICPKNSKPGDNIMIAIPQENYEAMSTAKNTAPCPNIFVKIPRISLDEIDGIQNDSYRQHISNYVSTVMMQYRMCFATNCDHDYQKRRGTPVKQYSTGLACQHCSADDSAEIIPVQARFFPRHPDELCVFAFALMVRHILFCEKCPRKVRVFVNHLRLLYGDAIEYAVCHDMLSYFSRIDERLRALQTFYQDWGKHQRLQDSNGNGCLKDKDGDSSRIGVHESFNRKRKIQLADLEHTIDVDRHLASKEAPKPTLKEDDCIEIVVNPDKYLSFFENTGT